MDCRWSCHRPSSREIQRVPFHNEENLRLAVPGLHELKAQVRGLAATLRLGAWLVACAPADEWGPPRCPDRRLSTVNASDPAALVDPPSDPTSLRRAIASRRETRPRDVRAARIL